MRQRRVKNRDSILTTCQDYKYEKPQEKPIFDKPTYLEIGSGKGQFLTQQALANPENFYLACEGGLNISVRILQKAEELQLQNLKVITEYITVPTDWFAPDTLAGIYINFCDPWPKDRHAHRRLTYRKLLEQYKVIAKPGACLEFKTDNDQLFEWSLEEFEAAGLMPPEEFTRDLWNSEFAEKNIHTEYEDKFGMNGKTINYIKVKLKADL